jgi:hypothetical protein
MADGCKKGRNDMTVQVEFIPREGAAPKGKEWESFLAQQAEVLDRRSADGWELASTISIISTSGYGSRTSGVLLYFRKPQT